MTAFIVQTETKEKKLEFHERQSHYLDMLNEATKKRSSVLKWL
jgi:hypothetical protein